jgi:ABC-2 type transport system ATP-binding protein
MPEPLVRFRGVNKTFGKAAALRGVDFDILAGRSTGLTGLNGAGKTTLVKCLLDFCSLDAGSIDIGGIEHRKPRARARLAFLPERFTAPYFLSGREFIVMMLDLFGCSYQEQRVRAMFQALDLDPASLAKPVRTYSKGMTQKLGLAACFLSGKELLVLDEPMSGLDAKARARVKELLLALKEEGRSLLFTSHSLDDVREVCDHVTVLHAGALAYTGDPGELCQRFGESSLERAFLKCIDGIDAHA